MVAILLQAQTLVDQESVNNTLENISEYGMSYTTAAIYLTFSIAVFSTMFLWFNRVINNLIKNNDKILKEILSETQNQNSQLAILVENSRDETLNRIHTISNALFDVSFWHTLNTIKRIRKENHIADVETTKKKIRDLVTIEYDSGCHKLGAFSYEGNHLSKFVNRAWIDWICHVIESEVYNELGENDSRAYTNVSMTFNQIKIDFNKRICK